MRREGRHRMIALLIKSPPLAVHFAHMHTAVLGPRLARPDPIQLTVSSLLFLSLPLPLSLSLLHPSPPPPSPPSPPFLFYLPSVIPFLFFLPSPSSLLPSTISRPLETNWSQAACHSNQTLSRSLRLNRYTTIVSKSPAVIDQSLSPPSSAVVVALFAHVAVSLSVDPIRLLGWSEEDQ